MWKWQGETLVAKWLCPLKGGGGGGLSPRISDRSLVHYVTGGLAGALLLPRVSIDFARMHHPEYLINVELLIWQRQKYWTARYWSHLDWITICINPVAAFTCQLYCCNNLSFWFLISYRIKHIFLRPLFVPFNSHACLSDEDERETIYV